MDLLSGLFSLFAFLVQSSHPLDMKSNKYGPEYITIKDGVDLRKENSIYAAIEHMKPLVEIEDRLMNILPTDYLQQQIDQRTDLSVFAISAQEFSGFELEYDEDVEQYLGNPVNGYMIIRRFVHGWFKLLSREDLVAEARRDVQVILRNNYMYMPSEDVDLLGMFFIHLR